MPRALVTGITGFVGGGLGASLRSAGWDVTGIYRSSTPIAAVDNLRAAGVSMVSISNHSQLREVARTARPNAVFHLATYQAKTWEPEDVDSFIESNIALGTNLLESLRGTACVFINVTSYSQYRHNQPAPYSMYSATKQAFVEISHFYRDRCEMDVREVILYDNFGPRDDRDKLVTQLLAALRDDTEIRLGPGSQKMNALYIEDLASGLIASAQPGNPQVMTVRAKDDATVGEIVAEFERAAGRDVRKTYDESRVAHTMVEESGSWPTPIGWAPANTLAQGIEATYRWFTDATGER